MRFFIAAVLYLVSLAMIVVGVAERTIWAPAPSAEYAVVLDGKSAYTLIDHGTLSKFKGQPTVEIRGGSPTNLAILARESDILGWLGDNAQTRIVFDKTGKKLTFANISGPVETLDPKASDMWRDVRSSEEGLTFVANPVNEGALLIASDGVQPSPNAISLIWSIPYDLMPSNILIVGGLGLLLAGIILNLIAYYGMRKKRGPRRRTPRAPQGPRYRPGRKNRAKVANTRGRRAARKVTAVTTAGIMLASLSGCSAPNPVASPTPSDTAAVQADPAVLDALQLKKIVDDIVKVAAAADEAKSAEALTSRFAGPALVARTAHYKLQGKSNDIANLSPIAADNVSFKLPAASRVWPRIAMVVASSNDQTQLPQVLVLQQESPRELYKVWYDIAVLPGVEFPSVPTAEVGSIAITPDSLFLKVRPDQMPETYGDVINNGTSSSFASLFDIENDIFYQQVSQSQRDTIAKLTKATVIVTHTLGESNVLSLATMNSGALVAVYMNDVYSIKPKKKAAVTLEGNEKLMFGSQGSAKGIISTYGDLMLFYVPGASSDEQIRTLGATQFLLSVKGM